MMVVGRKAGDVAGEFKKNLGVLKNQQTND